MSESRNQKQDSTPESGSPKGDDFAQWEQKISSNLPGFLDAPIESTRTRTRTRRSTRFRLWASGYVKSVHDRGKR